jgi:hypothetical protein
MCRPLSNVLGVQKVDEVIEYVINRPHSGSGAATAELFVSESYCRFAKKGAAAPQIAMRLVPQALLDLYSA